MSLESIISLYGYPAIILGTFFEAETILAMAGFAAHQGYLKLEWVILSGFLGTLCGDQLYFYIGRRKGTAFLEKRPYWKSRSQLIFDLLKRHQLLLILGFRFVYGLRTATPFVIGASGRYIAPSFFDPEHRERPDLGNVDRICRISFWSCIGTISRKTRTL